MKVLPLEIIKANKSARSAGIVGKNALVPRFVEDVLSRELHILDYGCGPDQIHAHRLNDLGFKVDAYDFGNNRKPGMVTKVARSSYDVVYASNVANTWSDAKMQGRALMEIHKGIKRGGLLIINYPQSPRYFEEQDSNAFKKVLETLFTVSSAGKNIFICTKQLTNIKKLIRLKNMKTKTKTATAWVIRNIKTGRFLNRNTKSVYTANLENALVYSSRASARDDRFAEEGETVNKVIINEKSRPIEVIAGNGSNCRF